MGPEGLHRGTPEHFPEQTICTIIVHGVCVWGKERQEASEKVNKTHNVPTSTLQTTFSLLSFVACNPTWKKKYIYTYIINNNYSRLLGLVKLPKLFVIIIIVHN